MRDVIGGALQARFVALTEDSAPWPCELPAANSVKLKVAESGGTGGGAGGEGGGWTVKETASKRLVAQADLEPSEIQDLADLIPQLLEIKSKANTPLAFRVRVEVGDDESDPDAESTNAISKLLEGIRDDFKLQ